MAAPVVGGTGGHAATGQPFRSRNGGEHRHQRREQGTKEIIMLTDSDIMAVLPAKDINRAKEFYRDKLGLEPVRVR